MSDDTKTIIDYFSDNVKKLGSKTFLTQPMGGGNANIKTFSYQEVLDEAKKVAGYIESLGYPPKSQIAICSKNCAHWVIADLGIMLAGHVSVPVYPTLTSETTRYILEHSESKMVFIGKLDEKPWEEMKAGIPSTMDAVTFPLCPKDTLHAKKWDDVIATSSPIATPVKRTKDEMATIIYTSGSTGKPKGVMTSFKAMTDTSKGITKVLKITSGDRYLSYLPIAHGMERWLGMCVPMYTGMQVFYAEALTTFIADLNRCEPTLFLSVPRLWTKFQAGVFSKMPEKKVNTLLSIPLLNILVKKKLLKGLGLSKVRFAGSGSAPLPEALLSWYTRLGLELLEGYGMTENFNYSHSSKPGNARVGYVGNAYDDVECRIASDGEIQVKTPGAMMGYFKNSEATAETITADGFVRTGDKGVLDDKGRLKITGRTKEIFKTSKGKYVAPAPIENLLISNQYVELACVGGKSQPMPFAIIQLSDAPKAKAIASESEREVLGKALLEHLKSVNPTLDGHEHLKFLVIVKDDWLPENGFLTPTQKIKRTTIEDNYDPKVEGWYAANKKIIWDGF
uniref:AMP-dependent synthetase/ligase domain-containing protein n=1 Tax=Pseudo-nitzschia australis TaxID=44445 RepID=A0A7S4AXW4_9STRA|mmetsp:Transcript_3755/g.8080  ORF Transcript_3755/g.8080 Transcript_3755/m.8080 type:complete len:565 (-) Transcript_3755:320-2014(-)|eukprot:CAMPEP_0168177344 /NCGR_PEP_ID=MMETSP0139_2-20121125/8391_1 /TAXON_ID=44445 /ORGANISM="Pseudo-nitzschia australis, Strain 10249 10 AB" /LENGTH=564 /DNA_ID=CAMNT_0008096363 /DNA_START=84 /DNA_END=1778 /DNA_ORIENTATION=-